MPLPSPSFFVLRAPLLPFDLLVEWGAALFASDAGDGTDLRTRLDADRARLRQSYRALLDSPAVRDALFVASPDLDRALEHWFREPASERGQAAERALTRYLTRMAARPTPFGLFGSTALGRLGETTVLDVSPSTACRRHTRLDMDYLVALVDALQRRPEVRAHLRYRPADSLYRAAGRWRYVETRLTGKVRSHHLVSLEPSEALDDTIARARQGAGFEALASALVAPGISRAEAHDYIDALIDAQVLSGDLACAVTGPEPHGVIRDRLAAMPATAAEAATLTAVARDLAAIDAAPLGTPPERYRDLARALEALPAPVDLARLFQVDLVRPAGATLGPDALAAICRGVELLHRLQVPPHERELERLRAAWAERYEERPVRLAEALDSDLGVGAQLGGDDRGSSVLLDGLDVPAPPRSAVGWGDRERHLLDLVGRALQAGDRELSLTEADLRVLSAAHPRPLPRGYAAMATLVANDDAAPAVLMHSVVGPSGARLLGRFCHADAALYDEVQAYLRAEEALDPEAVFAEIAHLPEGRVGNVILRPLLRAHEIPYLGASGADPNAQIRVDDLTAQLVDGRFVLRSMRLNRRVVPRLSSAHNFTAHAVGIYRFLCLVQADTHLEGAAWDWGPLAALPALPRVRVGDVVLTRAQWRLTKADLAPLTTADATARFEAVQRLRQARRLPRWVVLAEHDNMLPVDLDNVLAVESFVALVKGRDEATLLELYPGPDALLARGPAGGYAHEVIVPFVEAPPVEARASAERGSDVTAATARRSRASEPRRRFQPGTEWVFAKLYGGSGEADRVLRQTVGPVSRTLHSRGAITRWFFIRYLDPDEHVRWRLQVPEGASPTRVRSAMETALARLLDDGLVRRVTVDTYEREVERYGGAEAMPLAEQWFHADSECTIDLLDALDAGPVSPDDRWQMGALGVDRLLTDLGCDLAARAEVMRRLRESFGKEFRVDAAFRRQLADKLRPVARPLDRLLADGPAKGSVLAAADAAFARRRRQSRAALTRLRTLETRGRLTVPVADLVPTYVHMTLNRLFRSEHRLHELVIYDFLTALYRARLARRD